MTAEYIVIKIGGVASKQLTPEILAKLSEWQFSQYLGRYWLNCQNGSRLVRKLLSSMGVVLLLIS